MSNGLDAMIALILLCKIGLPTLYLILQLSRPRRPVRSGGRRRR